jgi:hypothetical protein
MISADETYDLAGQRRILDDMLEFADVKRQEAIRSAAEMGVKIVNEGGDESE